MFKIEDDIHAEIQDGEFETLEAALGELRYRAQLPWDAAPNVAPCVNSRTCGRSYEIVEYHVADGKWQQLRRFAALEIDSAGIKWLVPRTSL